MKKKAPKEAQTFADLMDSLYKIVMRIVTLVLRLTPYGVLALMTNVLASSDFRSDPKSWEIYFSFLCSIDHCLARSFLVVSECKSQSNYLFQESFSSVKFCIYFTLKCRCVAIEYRNANKKALGVDEATANFAGSFGLSIGQNGCAGVYPAMLATIVAPTVGINVFDWQFILLLVAVVTISSFGVAGVGGGATFASLIVLGSMNLPIAIVGLVISVEPLIDMARTLVNVSDSMVAGVVTSSRIHELDRATLESQTAVIDAD